MQGQERGVSDANRIVIDERRSPAPKAARRLAVAMSGAVTIGRAVFIDAREIEGFFERAAKAA